MTSATVVRAVLRALAILIAVAGMVDPAWTIDRGRAEPVVVVRATAALAPELRDSLEGALGSPVLVRDITDRRLPCAAEEPCVIVADGSMALDLPGDRRALTALITPPPIGTPNVALTSAALTPLQHASAAAQARIAITGAGVAGRRTGIRISDGAALSGSAVHEWKQDGEAVVDVPWWPLGTGPRTLRIEAVALEGEASTADNVLDAAVEVSQVRAPVLIFEARPSWNATFVRRALEDDPRFAVEHRARFAPSATVSTARGRLDAAALEQSDVTVVGGVDILPANEVDLLDRYIRERGGTVILLPDRPGLGAAGRLWPGRWTQHLTPSPVEVGGLRATEILSTDATTSIDIVLGRVESSPSIVVRPTGNGRFVVAGAMDAWRYRDHDGAGFTRFWTSLAAESARLSARVQLTFDRSVAATNSSVDFTVRHRSMTESGMQSLGAVADCADQPSKTLRLWPGGENGVFRGTVSAEGGEACYVRVAIDGAPVATAGFSVTKSPIVGVNATLQKFERFVRLQGGVVGDEEAIAERLRTRDMSSQSQQLHPMRSPLWILPFVACLAAEWWLRRRGGLR